MQVLKASEDLTQGAWQWKVESNMQSKVIFVQTYDLYNAINTEIYTGVWFSDCEVQNILAHIQWSIFQTGSSLLPLKGVTVSMDDRDMYLFSSALLLNCVGCFMFNNVSLSGSPVFIDGRISQIIKI